MMALQLKWFFFYHIHHHIPPAPGRKKKFEAHKKNSPSVLQSVCWIGEFSSANQICKSLGAV